jgi:hypothetical protein
MRFTGSFDFFPKFAGLITTMAELLCVPSINEAITLTGDFDPNTNCWMENPSLTRTPSPS